MQKQLFILIFTICSILNSSAQLTFQKRFGGPNNDYARCVINTLDGGYLMAGETANFGASGTDPYLLKTNANGNHQWAKTFRDFAGSWFWSVLQTSDSSYVVAGEIYDSVITNNIPLILKTNSSGDTLWTRTFGQSNLGGRLNSIEQTADGGFIAAGYTATSGSLFLHMYLIKTDANGNMLWDKVISGGGTDIAFQVKQTTDGGYIVVGHSNSFLGNTNVFMVKTDSVGSVQWAKTFGGTNLEFGYGIEQTSDDGFVIIGRTNSAGAGLYDIYLIKTDSSGNMLWSKRYGGSDEDFGNKIIITSEGGFLITGYTKSFGNNGDAYVIKTDSLGNMQWNKKYGGTGIDQAYNTEETPDGGYIICGYTFSFGATNADMYMIKTDSAGNAGCYFSTTSPTIGTPTYQAINQTPSAFPSGNVLQHTPIIIGSGYMDTTICTTVGLDKLESHFSMCLVYPNPVNDGFTITLNSKIYSGTIEIFNSCGMNVYKNFITGEKIKEVTTKDFSDGIYFVKVFDGENYYCKKLIVEHN